MLESFLWGAGGSAAVEILVALRVYENDAPTPIRYSKPGFWVSRALVALIAGGLVVAHHIHGQPLLSIHIGIATPAIFAGLAEEIRSVSRQSAE